MYQDFKVRCFSEIERTITDVKFIKSPVGIFITYKCQHKKQNIFVTKKDVGEILLEENIIQKVACDGDKVTFLNKVLFTATTSKGAPVQYERYVEYKWEDLDMNEMFVQGIAVLYEFDRVNRLAKVVAFTKYSFSKVA